MFLALCLVLPAKANNRSDRLRIKPGALSLRVDIFDVVFDCLLLFVHPLDALDDGAKLPGSDCLQRFRRVVMIDQLATLLWCYKEPPASGRSTGSRKGIMHNTKRMTSIFVDSYKNSCARQGASMSTETSSPQKADTMENDGEETDATIETIGDRVRKGREAKGWSQRDLARESGVSQQSIGALEKGKGSSTFLVPLAKALHLTPEYLWSGQPSTGSLASKKLDDMANPLVRRAPVIGEVAAGVWREQKLRAVDSEEIAEYIPYLPTKRFEGLPQYGIRVKGDAMNKVVKDGEFVAVVFLEDGANYQVDDIVVIEKSRGGLHELTLKRVKRMTEDQVFLEPESEDPKYLPLILGRNNADNEVVIIAVAVGKYAPF